MTTVAIWHSLFLKTLSCLPSYVACELTLLTFSRSKTLREFSGPKLRARTRFVPSQFTDLSSPRALESDDSAAEKLRDHNKQPLSVLFCSFEFALDIVQEVKQNRVNSCRHLMRWIYIFLAIYYETRCNKIYKQKFVLCAKNTQIMPCLNVLNCYVSLAKNWGTPWKIVQTWACASLVEAKDMLPKIVQANWLKICSNSRLCHRINWRTL